MHTFTQAAHPLYIMLFCIAFSNLPLCVRLLAKPGFNCFNHCFHGLFFIFPSQISSISSPDFTHAPRTLNTLFAFAAVSSLYMNSTLHLYLLAMLQNIPAGLRCNPVGFVIVTFCLIIMYSPHFCLLFALAVLIVFICLCLTAVLAFPLCFTALL